MADDLIGPILTDYVELATVALTPTPGRVIHTAVGATVAWDECCEGQLWGRVVSVVPNTGNARGAAVPCGVLSWTVTAAIGIIRCIAVVNDQAGVPAAGEIEADGRQMLKDLADIQQVILCHHKTRDISSWSPLQNQGGCSGGEWTFTFRVDVCGC